MIHYEMPAAEYHSRREISKSKLDLVHRSLANYLYGSMIGPSGPALDFGQAYHCHTLQPAVFSSTYAVAPRCDRRTNAGKAAWEAFLADNPGRIVISEQDYETIADMGAVISAHPIARQLVEADGHAEVSLFWEHNHLDVFARKTVIPMKARLDKLSGTAVIDLKSTTDASAYGFQRSVMKYRYHVQAAVYLDACEACGIEVDKFLLVAQEKGAPYNVAVYELDEEFIEAGREEYYADLDRYADFLADPDIWPGYPAEITTLSLPRWARPMQEDTDEQE